MMCKACSHPQRTAIDRLLAEGQHSRRSIAAQFGLKPAVLDRHVNNEHVPIHIRASVQITQAKHRASEIASMKRESEAQIEAVRQQASKLLDDLEDVRRLTMHGLQNMIAPQAPTTRSSRSKDGKDAKAQQADNRDGAVSIPVDEDGDPISPITGDIRSTDDPAQSGPTSITPLYMFDPSGVASFLKAHVNILELKGKVTGELPTGSGGNNHGATNNQFNGPTIVMMPSGTNKGEAAELIEQAKALAPPTTIEQCG